MSYLEKWYNIYRNNFIKLNKTKMYYRNLLNISNE